MKKRINYVKASRATNRLDFAEVLEQEIEKESSKLQSENAGKQNTATSRTSSNLLNLFETELYRNFLELQLAGDKG
jgi:hypothetical protein